MKDAVIGDHCVIDKAIIAENVQIGDNVTLGTGSDTPNKMRPDIYGFGLEMCIRDSAGSCPGFLDCSHMSICPCESYFFYVMHTRMLILDTIFNQIFDQIRRKMKLIKEIRKMCIRDRLK